MKWQDICNEPTLRDLPFKIETDRWGHIVMPPASNRHSLLQAQIQNLRRGHSIGGFAFPECSIQTDEGVKVADVAWGSDGFFRRYGMANPYPQAPEIVVEVASPSNFAAELEEKRALYFAQGANEVWICSDEGRMRFFDARGERDQSPLVPAFPLQVSLPMA